MRVERARLSRDLAPLRYSSWQFSHFAIQRSSCFSPRGDAGPQLSRVLACAAGPRLDARRERRAGKPGKRGKNGLSVRTMSLTGYTVTTGLSDGSRLHCNLPPALQSYDRARG